MLTGNGSRTKIWVNTSWGLCGHGRDMGKYGSFDSLDGRPTFTKSSNFFTSLMLSWYYSEIVCVLRFDFFAFDAGI